MAEPVPPKPPAPPAPPAPAAPKAAGADKAAGPVWVMAMQAGTFQHPNQPRAWHYDRGEKFQVPGQSFVRPWMRVIPGPNAAPPARPPETTAPNQPQPVPGPTPTPSSPGV